MNRKEPTPPLISVQDVIKSFTELKCPKHHIDAILEAYGDRVAITACCKDHQLKVREQVNKRVSEIVANKTAQHPEA